MKFIAKAIAAILSMTLLTACPYQEQMDSISLPLPQESQTVATVTIADTADLPPYTGEGAVAINGNTPFFTDADLTTTAFETYSELDYLGRCGVCYANVGLETMPTEERGEIGMVKPSGWHTFRYDDLVDGKYLYNRCHLIGFQLTGENANTRNLITGTRYLNVQVMVPYENKVANYVQETGNHVLYRVTPVFEGSNLVAQGVLMEAYSVEDDGGGVQFCVFCYNIQPGVIIDYATGESERDPTYEQPSATPLMGETTYILNTRSKKFHTTGCASVEQIKDYNKAETDKDRETLILEGYEPCGACNP